MRNFGYPTAVAEPLEYQTTRPSPPSAKTIPFDYVFEFKLQGKPASNVQTVVTAQDVVEISMQGVFVGVSMGYSFVLDERKTPRAFGPAIDQATIPTNPVFIPLFPLITGPLATTSSDLQGAIIAGTPGAEVVMVDATGQPLLPPQKIGADGTTTVTFPPAFSVGVVRVWDRTNNLLSEPVEVVGVTPTPVIGPLNNKLPSAGDKTVTVYGGAGDTVQLFFLEPASSRIQIDGTPTLDHPVTIGNGTTGSATVALKVSGADRPLSAGDVLLVQLVTPASGTAPGIGSSTFIVPRPLTPSTLTLGSIAAGLESINVDPTSGFRLSSRFANFFAADLPLNQITDPAIIGSAFEPACGPEDVSFLYSIDIVSTGRELQNKPIHNIAGLGIANGDRPFRPLARPIAFEPRSVIRIQIEELSTLPGTLYIVLQGYKILGTGRIPE